jgi:Uma2 family endonuclease
MTSTMAPPAAPSATPPAAQWRRKRWTIAEFDRLVTTGFLREGDRTFLWDGEIIEPMPENPPHVNAVANLVESVRARFLAAEWTVYQGAPVVLREGYKPQPDVSVLRGPRSTYRGRTPTAADAALLIEVADRTYPENAGPFLRAYAEAGVPRYWIVNISDRRVEVYTDPGRLADGSTGYRSRRDYGLDQSVPLEEVPGEVAVADVLRDSIEPAAGGGA